MSTSITPRFAWVPSLLVWRLGSRGAAQSHSEVALATFLSYPCEGSSRPTRACVDGALLTGAAEARSPRPRPADRPALGSGAQPDAVVPARRLRAARCPRSEEHTSELQSQSNLVCRL